MSYLDLFFSQKLAICVEGSTNEELQKIDVLLEEYPNKQNKYFTTAFSEFKNCANGKAVVGFFSYPFLTYVTKDGYMFPPYDKYQIVTTEEFLSSDFESVNLEEISEIDMLKIFKEGV